MNCRIVARLPPTQQPVQGNLVEQRLEWVVRAHHGLCHSHRHVVTDRQDCAVEAAEPVRLVIDNQIARRPVVTTDAEHRIDASGQIAAQRLGVEDRII